VCLWVGWIVWDELIEAFDKCIGWQIDNGLKIFGFKKEFQKDLA